MGHHGSRSRPRCELTTPPQHRQGGTRGPGATLAYPSDAEAFEHEYPGARWLDTQVMRQLQRAGAKVDALITRVARRHGLSHAALNALAVIEEAGGPVPAGQVSTQMHISTATMTSVLDTLERNGHIRRQPDPADRRRQVVQITEATTARDREVFGGLIRQTGDLLATYTDEQLAVIRDFLDRARQLTAAYADTLSRPAGTSAAQKAAHGTR